MGVFDFLKKKEEPVAKALVIPIDKKEKPDFPSPEEIPGFEEPKSLEPLDLSPLPEIKKPKEEKPIRVETPEELEHPTFNRPLFIDIDDYRELINEVNMVKTTLKEGTDSLARVSSFRENEEKEFNKWGIQIKDIQRKMLYVDKVLFAKLK